MRAFRVRAAAALVATLLLTGCAAAPSGCGRDEARQTAQLFFGLSVSHAPDISEAQFTAFLDQEVSSRFPQGLTVLDGQGRWLGAGGQMVREPSKLVMIVLPGGADDHAKLDAIRKAYELRFHQEAVLQVVSPGCVAF